MRVLLVVSTIPYHPWLNINHQKHQQTNEAMRIRGKLNQQAVLTNLPLNLPTTTNHRTLHFCQDREVLEQEIQELRLELTQAVVASAMVRVQGLAAVPVV